MRWISKVSGGIPGRLVFLIAVAALISSTGCREYGKQTGVTEAVQNAVEPFQAREILDSSLVLPVETYPVEDPERNTLFHVEKRTDELGRFRCSRCHITAVPLIENAAEITHGGIEINHGKPGDPLACYACHNEAERDFLLSEKGEKIDFNHTHLLCGRCHFREENDWMGGAHGKRISNWAGERIIKECSACHNPHAPAIASRWPATYSLPEE